LILIKQEYDGLMLQLQIYWLEFLQLHFLNKNL